MDGNRCNRRHINRCTGNIFAIGDDHRFDGNSDSDNDGMIRFEYSEEPFLARAKGVFWKQRIVLGSKIADLNMEQFEATIWHELGHLRGRHIEWRILFLFICPFLIPWLCKNQEILADSYAAKNGHAKGLIEILRSEYDGGLLQPSHKVRRKHLKKYVQNLA